MVRASLHGNMEAPTVGVNRILINTFLRLITFSFSYVCLINIFKTHGSLFEIEKNIISKFRFIFWLIINLTNYNTISVKRSLKKCKVFFLILVSIILVVDIYVKTRRCVWWKPWNVLENLICLNFDFFYNPYNIF